MSIIKINITGDIDAKLVKDVIKKLENYNNEKVIVVINSSGGNAEKAKYLFKRLSYIPEDKLITVCNGLSASVAAMIFLAAKFGNRYIIVKSNYALHSLAFFDNNEHYLLDDLIKIEKELEKSQEKSVNIFIDKAEFNWQPELSKLIKVLSRNVDYYKEILKERTALKTDMINSIFKSMLVVNFNTDHCIKYKIIPSQNILESILDIDKI